MGTTERRTTLADMLRGGLLDAYTAGPPSLAAGQIDSEVCDEAICDQCGTGPLLYRGFHRPGSYIALAICANPACRAAVEF